MHWAKPQQFHADHNIKPDFPNILAAMPKYVFFLFA